MWKNAALRATVIDDAFADVQRRDRFAIPDGVTYLDGNSLGALPHAAREALDAAVREEWGEGLIRSWNSADWLHLPQRVGDRLAPLLGAAQGTVIAADSTSLNLFKALQVALDLNPGRDTIVTDIDNFPTDLYGIDAVARQRGLRVVDVPRGEMASRIDERTAVVTLTHVDYRTSEMVDMAGITRLAHDAGALVVWDLAHSAGAVPLALGQCDVDLAIGCGYKFLNGGPGAPAFAYVAPRLADTVRQPLEGWMGHAAPFAFTRDYAPARGRDQFLVGTPAVLGLSALMGALSVFDGIDMTRLHAKSVAMAGLFHELADERLSSRGCTVASHRDATTRGSHVALAHPAGYAIVQALIARGIIGDFRRPDVMRFGIAPLYNSAADVVTLVQALVETIDSGEYEAFATESAVI